MNEAYNAPIICVNLCKAHGQENKLSEVYEAYHKNLTFKFPVKYDYFLNSIYKILLRYVHFDFHSECKNMDFTPLLGLLSKLRDDIVGVKYYIEQYAGTKSATLQVPKTLLSHSKSSEALTLDMAEVNSPENKQGIHFDQLEMDDAAPPQVKQQPIAPATTQEFNLLEFDSKPVTPTAPKPETSLLDFGDENPFTAVITKSNANTPTNPMPQPSPARKPLPPVPQQQPYLVPTKSTVLQSQAGVFRVNCIDCCDRTNVVETYISKTVLKQQLLNIGILTDKMQSTHQFPEFEAIFNHVWADNGDRVSILYSGTGALMGDYTRTGQRSVSGLLTDGWNSVNRYLQNNFTDAKRQRSMNLVLGLLDLNSKEESQQFGGSDIVNELFTF